MTLDALMLALVLVAAADPPQSHAAQPASKQTDPGAKPKPADQPSATGAADLAKLAEELKAVKDAALNRRPLRATSRPRTAPKPRLVRPPIPRYQLQWPSFEERWHLTWPEPLPERLGLVWPD